MNRNIGNLLIELSKAKVLTYELLLTNAKGEQQVEKHQIEAPDSLHESIAIALINKALTGDPEAIRLYHELTKQAI